jgi:hypothetical protein
MNKKKLDIEKEDYFIDILEKNYLIKNKEKLDSLCFCGK